MKGYPGPVGHELSVLDWGPAAIAAAAARHDLKDLYLFAVFAFDEVTDIDHAVVAAVAAGRLSVEIALERVRFRLGEHEA